MPIALLALTLSAFAIGTTEFVIVGLLPTVAADLSISIPSAGLLVSLYALGVAIGAPVLTALTGKLPRKWLLVGLMALFTVGNLLAWQAPRYETLVAARILTGLAHGVFFSIGSTIATGLVPRRIPSLPDMPAIAEAGVQGMEINISFGLYAPKGTPKPVLDKLSSALQAAVSDPDVRARLDGMGIAAVPVELARPEALRTHLKNEIETLGGLLVKAGVKPE